MADLEPLSGISQDETVQTALLLLARILDALPVPAAPGAAMQMVGTVSLAANQNLNAINSLAAVTNLSQLGGQPANTTVFDLMNINASALYDFWKVT